MSSLKNKTSEKSWVHVDLIDTNPSIIGNAEGLHKLRDKVDEAINSQYSLMEDLDCNFNQIRLTDNYPSDTKTSISVRLLTILFLIILILGLLTFFVLIGLLV